ncbi:ABC transporter substrate-binding protein [Actinospica durhamensis]|uniref:ABC transporter substrate-binding protein n=1 Tax=Actinospica durhamensis TaxID=1508375 RepID=A0A941ELI7_9ACTN|nr:ABC transporter substrate-binding protein [Actinospica durhamensis]MBR7834635.1 ABC transporter substrate-binding protein [Actinospica durhamensis]
MIVRPARCIALAGSAVLVLGVLAGCSKPGSSNTASTGSSTGPIKIAVVDAQSGQDSSLGQWEYDGAKLAVSQWNAKGGIDGRQIQLTVFDDKADPTTGTDIASKLASEGFVAMIGTAESGVTAAMEPTLEAAKIPNITSGQSPALTKSGDPYVFLNGPTSVTYDSTLAAYLTGTLHDTKIAMITNNGAYGAGEQSSFLAQLTADGLKPTSNQVVTTTQTDFSSALTAIKQSNPQVVFIGSEEVEAGLIVKQARSLGITVPFAGGAPQGTPVFIDTAGTANVEGTIVSSPYLSNDTSAASKAFAAAYQGAYGSAAELHGAKAYDGTEILLTALKTSGLATGLKLADAIRATQYDGLLGDFRYDKTGVGIFKTSIGIVKNGSLVAVG